MEYFGLFILLWLITIAIFRFTIQILVLKKYKVLIAELSIDRLLLFVPEICPLNELAKSRNVVLNKAYKIIMAYKFIFWIGFYMSIIIVLFN